MPGIKRGQKLADLRVRVPESTKTWLGSEAARQGLTVSSFVRSHLMQFEQERKAA